MSKQESLIIKEVAILLMIFLHLFNQEQNVSLCDNLIHIDGTPLVLILSRAANPIAWFLIIGGYGMYKVWLKGDRNRYRRVFKLYLSYWITLAVFLTIGHFIYPQHYPGSVLKIIENATGFNTSYNGEMWFLLPYVILGLLSPYYFRATQHIKIRYIIIATFLLNLATSYTISRYGAKYLFNNHALYNCFLVLHLLFSFTLGAMAARYDFFNKFKYWSQKHGLYNNSIIWGGVVLLFVIACSFKYFFGFAFFTISLILIAPRATWVNKILTAFGNNSMNMWFIHTWLCYYLFHDFIYSLSYPLLIFVSLTSITYVCALFVNPIELFFERSFTLCSNALKKRSYNEIN